MEHLKFWLELCDWLGFVFVVDHNHASADVFSNKFFVSFHSFDTNASQFTCIGFIAVHSVHMDRLDNDLLEILEYIRTQKALFIDGCNTRTNNTWKHKTNTFYQEIFVNFEFERLFNRIFQSQNLTFLKLVNEIDQSWKSDFGNTWNWENWADVTRWHELGHFLDLLK